MNLQGTRVTVLGIGIEGISLVRYLCRQGALVTISDSRPAEALQENLAQVTGLPVTLALGANRPEDCTAADILFISQGVPLDLPGVQAARQAGIPFSSVTRLFMELCPAPIVGITGSAGKSTTTSVVGEMFKAAGRKTFVGGNLGVMLLDQLDAITPDSWVVLEISHSQLELTDRSPHIAAVTNISPSHADRYPSLEGYIELKKHLYRFQAPHDWLVVNADDPVTAAMPRECPARPVMFSLERDPGGDAAWVEDGTLTVRIAAETHPIMPVDAIQLMGLHNRANIAAACAIAAAAGLPAGAMAGAVRGFTGVPHRLEWVRQIDGVDFYDDSIATTPERTVAGLRSFHRPVVLLAGGKDKNLPLEHWAEQVVQRCRAVVCFGAAGPMLQDALGPAWNSRDEGGRRKAEGGRQNDALTPGRNSPAGLVKVDTLEEAVPTAHALAQPGDVVLLSPACTSFDRYPNFEVRGRHFKELVAALAGERS